VKLFLCFGYKHAVPDYLIFGIVFTGGAGSWFGIPKGCVESNKEVNTDSKDHNTS
jgi:hypothetical protein